MAYLNKLQLIGNIGKNPEVRTFGDDSKVANFTLATTKRYTARDGQQMESTTWHSIQVAGKTAEFAEKYLHKGDTVYVEGELVSRSYQDQSGQTKVVFEVRASQVQILSQKQGERQVPQAPQANSNAQPAQASDDLPW